MIKKNGVGKKAYPLYTTSSDTEKERLNPFQKNFRELSVKRQKKK